jgi:hypothetical protein
MNPAKRTRPMALLALAFGRIEFERVPTPSPTADAPREFANHHFSIIRPAEFTMRPGGLRQVFRRYRRYNRNGAKAEGSRQKAEAAVPGKFRLRFSKAEPIGSLP